jgi:hypothetical protein
MKKETKKSSPLKKRKPIKRRPVKRKTTSTSHIQSQTYRDYLHSDNWRELRREAFALVNNRCVNCGGTASELHHLNYFNLQHETIGIDVVPLCGKCHKFCHWKRNWGNEKGRQRMACILRQKFLVITSS